jgi:hypothetical protein
MLVILHHCYSIHFLRKCCTRYVRKLNVSFFLIVLLLLYVGTSVRKMERSPVVTTKLVVESKSEDR